MSLAAMFSILWAVVLLNFVLTLQLTKRLRFILDPARNPAPIPLPPVDHRAPAFTARTVTGDSFSSNEYVAQGLILVFISHRCPTCRSHLPTLTALHAPARREGTELVLVVFDEDARSPAAAAALRADFEFPGTVLLASPEDDFIRSYNRTSASPIFCQIDSGMIRSAGSLHSDSWNDHLSRFGLRDKPRRFQLRRSS